MKKIISYLVLAISIVIASASMVHAQEDMSNIRKLKMEIVLSEMSLESSVEKKFTPLYHKYSDETLVLKRKIKELDAASGNAQATINEREKLKQQLLDIEKKYKQDFLKIISASDLEKMYRGENRFRQTLLRLKGSR